MDLPTVPFAHVPRDPHGHFLLHFYGAVFLLLNHLRRLAPADDGLEQYYADYPFLKGYCDELCRQLPPELGWEQGAAWWGAAISAWERSGDGHLPLLALSRAAKLGMGDRLALILVGLIEEDSRFGALFGHLQAPLGERRPTVELLDQILAHIPEPTARGARTLLAHGLVEVVNRETPRAEWLPRVPELHWDAIRGEAPELVAPWCTYRPPGELLSVDDLALPDALRRRLTQASTLLASGVARVLVVRGAPGSERAEALGSVARALGLGVIEVIVSEALAEGRWALLGPLCALLGAMPAFIVELHPGELIELPHLPAYTGPVGIAASMQGGLGGPALERALSIELATPGPAERLHLWRVVLPKQPAPALGTLADGFILPAGTIRRAGPIALAQAALDERDMVEPGDVRAACRVLGQAALDTLATRLEPVGGWGHLVVGEGAGVRLRELERRCRYRERLGERLGPAFDGGHGRGVRALFVGASGTGKTLAARILAAELELDLYRVDLAAVVNKYIGETEKNLHSVLTRAEELDVVLLIDEGDALLGARTAVRSANDRYANLETNYLLQRIEHYQGIVVVTTNAGENIDPAFQRRMDVVVPFAAPQAEERLLIWQLHLAHEHQVSVATLEEVAAHCALSGGQIRGAALHAALLALDAGRPAVGDLELLEAVRAEYRKAGASYPLDEARPGAEQLLDQTRRFLEWLDI